MRASQQDVDTDVHRGAGRRKLACFIQRHDFEIAGRSSGLDRGIQVLQPLKRQAHILKADMMHPGGKGGFQMLFRVPDRFVVAGEHEDKTESHQAVPLLWADTSVLAYLMAVKRLDASALLVPAMSKAVP